MISQATHFVMDSIMCAMMNSTQWRLRHHAVTKERLEAYLDVCEKLDLNSYYSLPAATQTEWRRDGNRLSWNSPIVGIYPENNKASADLYDTLYSPNYKRAPTIILLHALMSANDFGYRKIALRFNKKGWNVLFPHLPYHYSRRPSGYANGALSITSDIIRNAEALRQSVIELRQLMAWARQRGSQRVALMGTSYGGWVSALTLALEMTDFSLLIQPISDVPHATFKSPASSTMSNLLRNNKIDASVIQRHAHLSSPMHLTPLTPADRITIIGGTHDRISPVISLKSLSSNWGGARYREVKQGHFGYAAMQCALAESDRYLDCIA